MNGFQSISIQNVFILMKNEQILIEEDEFQYALQLIFIQNGRALLENERV